MNTQKRTLENDPIVVGIGASAGGLEALEAMFDQMPTQTGMAFVIVQHLSPDFRSLMVELLSRHTKMAVHRVADGMKVEPNSVYLIPPKQDMVIKDGKLLLKERQKSKEVSLPIDHFLKSLAAANGNKSVAVILSGTGSDGLRGIKDIYDAGGLVIAQSAESARFDGMPRSAIDSGFADIVTSPEKIPLVLEEYSVHQDREKLRTQMVPEDESALESIFRAIQSRHRIDFSHYRPTTIGRRIKRRIEMDSSISNIQEYADLLADDMAELDRLYKDLLIGVTGFFRDTKPFQSLKQKYLKTLLAKHPANEEFRAWVAACATGEEAYSIAILIDECLQESGQRLHVKIFATDVHQRSINIAATGVYTKESLQGVSDQRLTRYFRRVDGGYQIAPEIRRMVVFAEHNLVRDPPFTRLALVTCRNFLIYLLPKSQSKVISHFHFGLKKGGVLLLGSSESPGDLANEFEAIDANSRLYRKTRDVQLKGRLLTDSLLRNTLHVGRFMPRQQAPLLRQRKDQSRLSADEVLGSLVPPGIVIDPAGRVTEVFQNAGKYLRVKDGILSSNLLDLVDEDLRLALGSAIQRCGKKSEPVCFDRMQIKTPSKDAQLVKLTVTPLPRHETPEKFVITIEELLGEPKPSDVQAKHVNLDEVAKGQLKHLEQELQHNREILQATIEEMETSNEELQATNEELIASNEELQSANEELHSVNEELFTVNGEYQRKISELTELTHDFDNLLESTEIHTLFLDNDLCIRKFTPRLAEILHLVPHDIGRKITAFLFNVDCEDLIGKISRVLETGEFWEESVRDSDSAEYLMRILPYKAGVETSGVVLTLTDISKLADAQAAVTLERERFERAIKANRDGTWDWPDLKSEQMWWSPGCYQLLGYEPDAFPALHSEWLKLIHPDDRDRIAQTSLPDSDKCYVEVHENFEYRMLHKSGEYRWYCHRAIVDHDGNGNAVRMTGSIADIQDRKSSETFREGIRLRDNFLSMLSHELRNPIGAVKNAMENIDGEKFENNPELNVVRRQTRQMARLLDDLLDVARFGRDKIEFRKEIVDLCQLVDSVIESVDYQLEKKQQFLKTSICEGPLNIIGDPTRISQAQTNLIVNASKFSEPGQEIVYSVHREDNEAVINVVDNGVGISDEMIEQVFELFVQSDDTLDRSAGGMGVGLSLSQKIIGAHQGTITANSDGLGCGSSFQIRLPLTKIDHEKREPRPPKILDHSMVCNVLLVEDNIDAREMLAKTFRRRDFEVFEAGDGRSAIESLEDFQPQVAVIDIGLPGINGFEVAKRIRQDSRWDGVVLIALTGYGQSDEKQAVLDSGFDHHITKPLEFSELHEKILNHLRKSKKNYSKDASVR